MAIKFRLRLFAGFFLAGLVLAAFLLPLFPPAPKQYSFTNDTFRKVPAPEITNDDHKETLVEALSKSQPNGEKDLIASKEFAQWAVLNNYAAGYKVIYPYGFKVDYDSSFFEAIAPSGGKVVVRINGKTFQTTIDVSKTNPSDLALLEAARRLIENSFQFISGPGYNPIEAKKRFGG